MIAAMNLKTVFILGGAESNTQSRERKNKNSKKI